MTTKDAPQGPEPAFLNEIEEMDGDIPRSRPPAGFEPHSQWTLSSADELSRLRAGLMEALSVTGSDDDQLPDTPAKLALLATELATNALKHGLPPTTVQLSRQGDQWLIDVADHDVESVPVYAGERVPGAGGLGLHLARMLSVVVGWYPGTGTKHVWAIFAAPRPVRE